MIDESLRLQLLARLRVDLAGGEDGYLLRGESGVPIRLSEPAHRILVGVAEGRTNDQIAADLRQIGVQSTPAAVAQRAASLLARIREIDSNPRRPVGFWLKRELVSARVASAVATPAARLFDPRVAAVTIAALVAGIVTFGGAPPTLEPGGLLVGYAVFLLSLAAHELGHAAASARFAVAPRGIGVVMYLIYPAFFSDVTDTWRLPRRQRVLVDLGGMYFQSLFGAVLSVLALVWATSALQLAVVLIGFSILVSLNPFLRFDGYWVFIDALGLPSTSSARRTFFRALASRLSGHPTDVGWSRGTFLAVTLYLAMLPIAWAYFIVAVGPFVVGQVTRYPSLLATFAGDLGQGRIATETVLHLLVSTLVSVGGLLMAYRSVIALVGLLPAARASWRSRRTALPG